MPVQSFVKLSINKDEEWCSMRISRKIDIEQLQNEKSELFDKHVLNILNGQVKFKDKGSCDSPFNEAMCVNANY